MPNKLAHCAVAAAVTGAVILNADVRNGRQTIAPIGGAALAALCTNLPDKLEPAIHSHHRQFFHSIAFASLVSYGMYKAYEWNPESDLDKLMRFCILVAGSGILIHLVMDSATPRSIPLLGKL